MNNLKDISIKKLKERGIDCKDLALLVYELQLPYNDTIKLQDCEEVIDSIFKKREVNHAILTGIAIDKAVEKKLLDEEINEIIFNDESLYGIDEILALGITNVFGTIAFTNFGYLDKLKPGIIGKIDKLGKENNICHTFLDDILAAIIAAGASKIAHKKTL